MAQHGYLREYDEGWDRGGDRDSDQERGWRGEGRERGRDWHADSRQDYDEDGRHSHGRSNFMFGERDRGFNSPNQGHLGGNDSRNMGERARAWFRDDDRQYRGSHQDQWESRGRGPSRGVGREHGSGGFEGDYGRSEHAQGGFGGRGEWERSPRSFSSHQDDHYRSWRDRQVQALDRDYEDYCRERERQFHSDFDSWRRSRQQRAQKGSGHQKPDHAGQDSSQERGGSQEVMELSNPTGRSPEPQSGPSPTGEATLGTNNSENSITGGRA